KTHQQTADAETCTAGILPIQHRSPEALGDQAATHRQTAYPVRKLSVNSRWSHSELGNISSVKGKATERWINSANRRCNIGRVNGGSRTPLATRRCFADAAGSLND
ncbi:hypothetical protein HAX54_025458, partial [Datura stramonium]|nr:hypothetical protein [Datura stramonium]